MDVKKRHIYGVPAVAAAVFGLATGVYAATDSDTASSASASTSTAQPPTAAVLKTLGVFRDAPKSRLATSSAPKLLGQPAETVIRAGTAANGSPIWISANGSEVCVYSLAKGAVGPGGTCDSIENVAKDGLYTSTVYSDKNIDVLGVAPDGASNVNVTAAGGDVTVPVINNVYSQHFDGPPTRLKYSGPAAGPVDQDLRLPSSK